MMRAARDDGADEDCRAGDHEGPEPDFLGACQVHRCSSARSRPSTLQRSPLPPAVADVFGGFVTAARVTAVLLTLGAEVTPYNDLKALGGLSEVKAAGKQRLEGKEYVVRDGEILNIRFAL